MTTHGVIEISALIVAGGGGLVVFDAWLHPGDRTRLAPASWVDSIKAHYARRGLEAGENATYRLHPSTWGYRHAKRYPDRVLCLELSRARLADPFTPFREMQIAPHKVEIMSEPIAAACLDELALREVV